MFTPCSDAADDAPGIPVVQELDNHDHQLEFCSPLCSCVCCHITIQVERVFNFDPIALIKGHPNLMDMVLTSRLSYSIWDPPKTA